MATLSCWTEVFCARRSMRLAAHWLIAIGPIVCAMETEAYAEPITFRFDAEIINTSSGNPFNLPFSYEVGDIITGRLTFEPVSGPAAGNSIAADQSFPLEISINGAFVSSSSYRIQSFDNTPITDSEFDGPVDTMAIGCSEPACIPEYVRLRGSEPFRVRSRMNLIGETDILGTAMISDDPAVWNAFTLERTLSLNFDNQDPGSMGLLAHVGDFRAVPEPGGLGLALCGILVATFILLISHLKRFRQVFRPTLHRLSASAQPDSPTKREQTKVPGTVLI